MERIERPIKYRPGTPEPLYGLYAQEDNGDEETVGTAWREDYARLFAAAPRLLEVCENVLGHARRHTDGSARFDAAWLDDLRVAIAEARGT